MYVLENWANWLRLYSARRSGLRAHFRHHHQHHHHHRATQRRNSQTATHHQSSPCTHLTGATSGNNPRDHYSGNTGYNSSATAWCGGGHENKAGPLYTSSEDPDTTHIGSSDTAHLNTESTASSTYQHHHHHHYSTHTHPTTTTTTTSTTTPGSPPHSPNGCGTTMGCCGKKKLLMIMTSVCACASFAFLCIAVATDYWLYAVEKVLDNNGTASYMKTITGLWRKCVDDIRNTPQIKCDYINYFRSMDRDGLGPTEAILLSMRRSTIFPLISLLILLVGEIVCFLGHCNHKRKVLTFVAGILYVIGGLCTLVGIILFIGAITEEVGNKPKSTVDDPKFVYSYGSSFMMTIGSFIGSELTGVFSVYLYISRHKHAYRKKQQERLTMMETNERPHHSRYRRPRSHSHERSREHSRDNSPSHSDTYYTYTPVSDTSKEMSNYTLPRDPSRHTISTTADMHQLVKEHSIHSVRELDTFRRTTPV